MRKVHLHGALSKYGDCLNLEVETAGEAVVAICANFPAAMTDIRDGSWTIMRGDPDTGMYLDEDMLTGMRLGAADLHIIPEITGAKSSSGTVKAILGVALIGLTAGAAAPFLANPIAAGLATGATWGNAIGQLGVAMALTGVSTMLAQETESGSDDEKSFTMTGPVSSSGQGHAVQIVYGGPVITGGMLISGGLDADGLETVKEAPVETPDPVSVEADNDTHNSAGGNGNFT